MPEPRRIRSNQRTMNRKAAAVAGPFRPSRSSASVPPAPVEPEEEILSFEVREFLKFATTTLGQAAQPIKDVATDVRRLLTELGFTGRARITTYKDRQYVVLNGYAGLRKYLTGTRYRPDNFKIVKILVGNTGRTISAVRGVPLTFLLVAGTDVLNHYLTDEQERQHLGLSIAADVAKNIAATAAGLLVAAGIAAATTVAIVPVAAGIAVAIAVGMALDQVAPTEDLVKAIQKSYDSLAVEVGRRIWEIERGIMGWMQITGFPYE